MPHCHTHPASASLSICQMEDHAPYAILGLYLSPQVIWGGYKPQLQQPDLIALAAAGTTFTLILALGQ